MRLYYIHHYGSATHTHHTDIPIQDYFHAVNDERTDFQT